MGRQLRRPASSPNAACRPAPSVTHQVPLGREQAEVMVEAVQNHGPDVVIVDEIGTKRVSWGGAGRGGRGSRVWWG
jgi:hypothetical protein